MFLAITNFCSSYVTEKKKKRLRETFVSMLSSGSWEKQQYVYSIDCGTLRFQESEQDLHYVGLIEKKILKKG